MGLHDERADAPGFTGVGIGERARAAGYVMLRLPHAVAPLFEQWLATHFPDRKDKVLGRLRAMRHGKLYDSAFGQRMRGEGIFADQTESLFDVACRKRGIAGTLPQLSTAAFRRQADQQLSLFQ